ncbi:MAG: hypothetical protein AB1918_13265 [Pseudomonadota bacterium]
MILRNVSVLIFAETQELADAGEAAARDPRLSRSRVEIQQGGVLAAADWLAAHPSPDVLMVWDPVDEGMWDRMEVLADNVEPHCRVIVVGPIDHIATYRELTSRGVADYLGGEVLPQEIADSICRLFSAEDSLPKGKAVLVTGAVGGAGASTVAAALASALAQRFGDCTLLDLDLPTGTAALMMGIDPRDPLALALANPGLDAPMLERFMARAGAVRVLSTPGSLRDAADLGADGAERLLAVVRSMSKAVVIDLPKGWNETAERLAVLVDEVVLVARPDLASLRNTRMVVDEVVSKRAEGRRPKVVLNFAGAAKKNEYANADFAEAGAAVPSALVPFDPEPLLAAIAEGLPVAKAQGKAMAAILDFADTLFAGEGAKVPAKGKRAKKGASVDLLGSLKARLSGLKARKSKA